MVTELLMAADRFAPTDKWHIDTLLKILTTVRGQRGVWPLRL
jgi:AP-1 complex subunit gamma-1